MTRETVIDLVDKKKIKELFGFDSIRRVEQLTEDGIIESVAMSQGKRTVQRYELEPTIKRYIKYLSDKAYGRERKKNSSGKEEEKMQAEIDFKKAKARMAELQLEELEGRMHSAEDVEAMTTDLCLAVRSALLSMPGQLAIDVEEAQNTAEASEIIKKTVNDILEELSGYEYDPEEYRRRVRERQGWIDKAENDEEDDE
ncbi:MAG: protoporphyrinogen oxidase [Ruminococcus sp.]|nr:protoporphyrinogen oxidase [Ruminococcus sp.]